MNNYLESLREVQMKYQTFLLNLQNQINKDDKQYLFQNVGGVVYDSEATQDTDEAVELVDPGAELEPPAAGRGYLAGD